MDWNRDLSEKCVICKETKGDHSAVDLHCPLRQANGDLAGWNEEKFSNELPAVTGDTIEIKQKFDAEFHAFLMLSDLVERLVPGAQLTKAQADEVHSTARLLAKDLTSGEYE